jgi:hypothetical protein
MDIAGVEDITRKKIMNRSIIRPFSMQRWEVPSYGLAPDEALTEN